MMLGLKYGEDVLSDGNESIPRIIPIGQRYLNRFGPSYGGTGCREISGIDYNEKEIVKKHISGAFLCCFKSICGGPTLLMNIMEEDLNAVPPDMDSETVKAQGKLLKLFRDKQCDVFNFWKMSPSLS